MPEEIKKLIFWVVVSILVVILVVLLVLKIKSKNKHYYGKNPKNRKLDKKIKKYARNRDFLFLTDVFLPVDNNKAILIDDIILGNKYIYVISQKHWDGYVKGFEYDTKWLLSAKIRTVYVDNPLIGNRYKVQTLMKFLKERNDENIVNIVSLSNKAKLNTIQTQPLENVVQMKHLFKLIDDYEKNSPFNDIKEEELERIALQLHEESIRISKTQMR